MSELAASVHRLELLSTLAAQMHGQLPHGKQRGACRLANLERIAHVIVVPVRECDMRDTISGRIPRRARALKRRIALEKGIDQDDARSRLNAKARMSKPRNLHAQEPSKPLGI